MAADISLTQNSFLDDSDEGVFEQADCSSGIGGVADDDILNPLAKIQKYAQSPDAYERQMVVRPVLKLFRTAPLEILVEDLPKIMKILQNIGQGDVTMVRMYVLERTPHIASLIMKCSNRHNNSNPIIKNCIGEYLLPMVVCNLDQTESGVDKMAHTTLINLLEQNLITKQQIEIKVCPTILALTNEQQMADMSEMVKNTGTITLMSKLAPLLGRDMTERIFLQRFAQLCSSEGFYVRKMCALHIGEFCAVVGEDKFIDILLPNYIVLCEDEVWGVRKSCAEIIMFVSSACPADLRYTQLTTAFTKLLKDDCRWVRISAFQALGPFIATFANPPIINIGYNKQRDLIFLDKEGNEFSKICPSSVPDVRFCKFSPNQTCYEDPFRPGNSDGLIFGNIKDTFLVDPERFIKKTRTYDNEDSDNEESDNLWGDDNDEDELLDEDNVNINQCSTSLTNTTDEDIKVIVKTVKNAVFNCGGNVEEQNQQEPIIDNLSNANNCDIKNENCDNLVSTSSTMNQINYDNAQSSMNIESKISENNNESIKTKQVICENDNCFNSDNNNENDDNLEMFNSYNYWYISPDLPVDLSIVDDVPKKSQSGKKENPNDIVGGIVFAEFIMFREGFLNYLRKLPEDLKFDKNELSKENLIYVQNLIRRNMLPDSVLIGAEVTTPGVKQNIVPQNLIDDFILMTDASFALYIDNEMSYHCAYSLPAVVLTLGPDNWPLLKNTVELLASDMQFKVRRTVASSLHKLAEILGTDIATRDLTPIFEGFIKDLDEVRIGILKNLANFLFWIKPIRRRTYLSRLSEFYDDINWRFRHELAKQLILSVPLFKPKNLADIAVIADVLLDDNVAAVRQVAISLVTELTMYFSKIPGLNSRWLVVLSESCAHSKKWKKRQTFALLCYSLLGAQSLPADQFATDIMPHLLDLTWDPVANVRLVVARTISKYIITNEFFSNPNSPHYDSLGTVLRRLQADKDRDVRYAAEGHDNDVAVLPGPDCLNLV